MIVTEPLTMIASCNVITSSFQSDIEILRVSPLIRNLTSILSCNGVWIAGWKPLVETYVLIISVTIHAIFLSFNWNSSAVGIVKLSMPHSRSSTTTFQISVATEGTGIRSDV